MKASGRCKCRCNYWSDCNTFTSTSTTRVIKCDTSSTSIVSFASNSFHRWQVISRWRRSWRFSKTQFLIFKNASYQLVARPIWETSCREDLTDGIHQIWYNVNDVAIHYISLVFCFVVIYETECEFLNQLKPAKVFFYHLIECWRLEALEFPSTRWI